MKDIWLCERKKDKFGKSIFKPIGRAEKTKKETPEFVVIEKSDPSELNIAMSECAKKGFELFDFHDTRSEFFSSFTAVMVNFKGGTQHGFKKTESAISRAIH
jgi:hypothetical protein